MRAPCRLLAALLWGLLLPAPARAQTEPAEGAEAATPRRTVERFLLSARAGRYAEAAKELEPPGAPGQGPLLARRLREVLDQRLELDLDKISDAPQGDLRDGISEDSEEIGRVPGTWGREPVRLRRLGQGEGARWVFSRQTLSRVPGWYDRLEDRWLRGRLPEPLWRSGPRGLLRWQWLALPMLCAAAGALAVMLLWLLRWVARPVLRRTRWAWNEELDERMRGPGRLVLTALLVHLGLPLLYLGAAGAQFVSSLLRAVLFFGVFWALWRSVGVLVEVVRGSAWLRGRPAAAAMIPLGQRLARLTLFALSLVVVLQELGYQVTSLLAGLGIGGLAVALAAQKTVEHVFGGIMLSVDQPMRVGDYVKVGDVQGYVEQIGLRSTRIRTLDRSLVTIPNGKLADMSIETLAARDRLRLQLTLGLHHDTPADKVQRLLDELEAMLKAQEKLWPELLVVRLSALSASSLDIEIMCWFQTEDFEEFRLIRQRVLLRILEIVRACGAVIASPVRTVHMVGSGGPPTTPGP